MLDYDMFSTYTVYTTYTVYVEMSTMKKKDT